MAACPVYSQGYIDASGWLANDYESMYIRNHTIEAPLTFGTMPGQVLFFY